MGKSMLKTCDINLQIIIATLIGLDLAKDLDIEEQNALANLLNIVATVLSTISTAEAIRVVKAKDPDADQQDESSDGLPSTPKVVHITPEVHERLVAEQEELRRRVEQLTLQVRELEERARKELK